MVISNIAEVFERNEQSLAIGSTADASAKRNGTNHKQRSMSPVGLGFRVRKQPHSRDLSNQGRMGTGSASTIAPH